MPVMIIDGLVSETTNFSITYAYSVDRSCTLIVPSTCDQQQWCNYTLTLDDCPTMTSGSGFFSVVPLNIIGRGKSTTSNMIGEKCDYSVYMYLYVLLESVCKHFL